jgi:arabinan endo-1,5-alpha-L-arabinosidase
VTPTLRAPFAPARRIALGATALAASLALGFTACGGGRTVTTAPVDTAGTGGPSATQYRNPVLNADFPDPAVMRAADGKYYAYATQTNGLRLQVSSSSDLVSWSGASEAMPTKPTWATQSGNFWAPDVELRGGVYVMYFSAQVDADKRPSANDSFCIGMATSTSPTGPFVDVGHPVRCGPGFTTIDPMGFDDPKTGNRYLYWGSSGIPLQVQQLSATDRSLFAAGSAPTSVVPVRVGGGGYDTGLIEGPWVTYREPYYYLYFSGNSCCGAGAHYAVMVARATTPVGPFTVLTSSNGAAQPILEASAKWIGPGHNSTIKDGAGAEWMLYHAIDVANPYLNAGNTDVSRRPMLLDRITYVNDWPTVGVNGTPTSTVQTRPTP